jgi:hypothetical protein
MHPPEPKRYDPDTRPIRADSADQVLATTGIHPRSFLWRFSPGGPPPIGLRQMLLGDARQ